MDKNWFTNLFINEAKPALQRHSGYGGSVDSEGDVFVLVDEDGNEATAVYVDEMVVFDATANDIRSGKTAATENGVTVGTKDIPAYYVTEGYTSVPPGGAFVIPAGKRYDFTSLQAIVCAWNGSMAKSVVAEKVAIDEDVYLVNSSESIAKVIKDSEKQEINLGITNESDRPYVLRYFSYKEEY